MTKRETVKKVSERESGQRALLGNVYSRPCFVADIFWLVSNSGDEMVLYFQRRVETALIGSGIVSVECRKSGFHYYYELTRIGTGASVAPYGIGAASAERSATRQSRQELTTRLGGEAELVPCPNCHWINADLVAGYRKSRYRQLGWLAAIIAFFGTISCLYCAWFVANGPAADQGALPYFLIYGPVLCLCLAGVTILMRSWLRAHIRPNQQFPQARQLPPGTPPALIANESTGELEVADTSRSNNANINTKEWHEFQIGRDHFPKICCVCLGDAQVTSPYVRQVTSSIKLQVPRCTECVRTANGVYWRTWLLATIVGMAFSFGGTALVGFAQEEYWIFSITLAIISMIFAAYLASPSATPVTIRSADSSRGILKLRFQNPHYGESYEQRNNESAIAR